MYEPMLSIAGNRKLSKGPEIPEGALTPVAGPAGVPAIVYALGGAALGFLFAKSDPRLSSSMGLILGGVIGLVAGNVITGNITTSAGPIEDSEELDVELEESF